MSVAAVIALSAFISSLKSEVNSIYVQPRHAKEPNFNLKTLKFVSVIARHGSRSDFDSFPTDTCPPNNPTLWPFGPGELTKVGRQQSYALGKQLRKRYGGFVGELYTQKETEFLSNLHPRDMLSAQLIAAGMYPPVSYEKWNGSDSNWQPIEVWPVAFDASETREGCPAFKSLMTASCKEASEEVYRENKDFIDRLAQLTGYDLETVKMRPQRVYDPIYFEKQNGLPVPDWVDDTLLFKLNELGSKMFVTEHFGSPKQLQIGAGPIVKNLLEELSGTSESPRFRKPKGKSVKTKLKVMAGHDSTIIAVKLSFGITEYAIPRPSSFLAVELHQIANDSFVQMAFFNDSSTIEPTIFNIPECSHPCGLDRFTEIGKRVIIDNWNDECQGINASSTSSASSLLVLGVISLFLSYKSTE